MLITYGRCSVGIKRLDNSSHEPFFKSGSKNFASKFDSFNAVKASEVMLACSPGRAVVV